jgi:hypothetical protein
MSDDENILLGPGAFRVWSVRHGHTLNHFPKESDEMSDLIELRTWLDIVAEKDAEIARLQRRAESLVNQNERLLAALEEIAKRDPERSAPIARKALEDGK